jgi:hypothetical protein
LIGRAWKHREVWSGPVLIGRGLDHKAELPRDFLARIHCSDLRPPPVPELVASAGCVSQCYGRHGGGETPGPIPNPEAKPASADGTARGTWWESRTRPD